MTELRNRRRELFAQGLAAGKNTMQAYADAGFEPCRQNSHRLASIDAVKERVLELRTHQEPNNKSDRDTETGKFLQGVSGNPVGRPRGSRNKLGEQFIADLHSAWQRSGANALKRVVEMDPVAFVKVVAQVLPHKVDTTINIDSELFREVADFHAAWALARQHIGADDDRPLIELQAVEEPTDAG